MRPVMLIGSSGPVAPVVRLSQDSAKAFVECKDDTPYTVNGMTFKHGPDSCSMPGYDPDRPDW